MTKISRYPGIRSFERAEQALFFGRSRELAALFDAVKVKPLTVLFAKSGIGKTSLLNAGLLPMLEQNGFFPVSVRLQDTGISPVETLKKVLQPYLNSAKLERFGRAPYSLWEYVRACEFSTPTLSSEPSPAPNLVLVFDQFEELFSHDRPQRDELTTALADLLNERLPDLIRQRLREHPREQRTDELLDWYEPMKIKVVFAIRADRLSDLDELKRHIPTVLHDRFHLRPLSYENARAAIEQPAALSGTAFSSPSFSYAPAAIQEILESLDNEQGEIESFQLQLLCRYLENIVSRPGQVITSADFGGAEGINSILNDYYERALAELDPEEQITARRFIEEGLIVSGRRTGVPEGTEQTRFGIGPDLLAKLLNSRLLRAETIHLGKIYELSHDTLVEPVLRSYERRRQEEERQEVARQLAGERARLAELGQKRARARMLAIAGFALAGLAIVGGVLAWFNGQKAEKALAQAEIATLANKAWSVYREDHTMAFRLAQAALNIDTTNDEAQQTLRNIVNDPTTAFYKTVFAGHRFEVRALAFSPDGQTLASGSFDSDIRVWDLNGRTRYVIQGSKSGGLQGHAESVNAVAFSTDGAALYSGGGDGKIKGWAADTGDSLFSWAAHKEGIWDIHVSPDGQYLLSASADGTAKLWQISTGKCLHTFQGHNNVVKSARFSPDQQRILTGGLDGSVRLWSLDGRCLRTIQLTDVKVNAAQFSPDGQLILLGCSDHTAKLFDLEGHLLNSLSSHTAEVTKATFAPDGRYILTASNDHTARLWTSKGEEQLRLIGHTERLAAAVFSPDGHSVVTSGWDFTAKLWNIEFNLTNKAARHLDHVNKVQVSPDGSVVFTCSVDNTLKKWDIEGDLLADMRGHTARVNSLHRSPDGAMLLSASDDKTIRLWSSLDGKCLRTWAEFNRSVRQAVFHPDGRSFTALEGDGTVSVWPLEGKLLYRWKIDAPMTEQCLALSPDGQRVFVSGNDGLIHIRTLSGEPIDTLQNDGVLIWSMKVSPDGNRLLTAGQEYAVRSWDLKGHSFEKYFGHLEANYEVEWSADGSRFVSAGWDWTAKIWDQTGKNLLTLKHPDGVYGACFSPDGRLVITACRDRITRVWDASTGKMLNTIGSRLRVGPFLRSAEIAGLESIAFDWERYGISAELAAKIYRNDPAALCRQASQYATKGAAAMGNYEEGLRYLQEAENLFLSARRLSQADAIQLPFDSLIAEVYSVRSNLFLIHRQFNKALQTTRDGMRYQALDFLKIYEINCLLLDGQYETALQKARAIRDQPVTQISFYLDMTVGAAIESELAFYKEQYGIQCPDEERFVKDLKE